MFMRNWYVFMFAQLGHYREEVRQYEQLAVSNKELGRHEAAMVYEAQVDVLNAQLTALQQQLSEALLVSKPQAQIKAQVGVKLYFAE